MNVLTYLFLDRRTQEALDFYRNAIGAEVTMLMNFRIAGQVTHAAGQRRQGHACRVQGRRHPDHDFGRHEQGSPKFDGFALSINAKDVAEAQKYFSALLEGGEVTMPLAETFFAKTFGMLKDKFGVHGWSACRICEELRAVAPAPDQVLSRLPRKVGRPMPVDWKPPSTQSTWPVT